MTDSIAVLPPGWRALDNNGEIITQATLHFYRTDGVTPKTVYADADLSVSLGTTVSCNSGGYPVSGANAKVLIYVGSDPYNVLLKNSGGVTVWSHENVKGAVDTSTFLTSGGLVAASPVVAVASSTTRTTADAGKIISANTTGGDITTTIPDAATAGNGFRIGLRHGGTANEHIVESAGGSFFGALGSNVSALQIIIREQGETVWCVSNGANWLIDNHQIFDPWLFKPIGEPFVLMDTLAGVSEPPTDRSYRYILLTAGEDGTGEYNEGVLINESVSGSDPDIVATAQIDDDASPLDGQTVRLINTTREFLRPGSAGTTQSYAIQAHTHSYNTRVNGGSGGEGGSNFLGTTSSTNTGSTGGTETRPRNIGINYYMRIR